MEKHSVVILAGGRGRRMKSTLPKVLHTLSNRPMVYYTLDTLAKLKGEQTIVVVSYKKDLVMRQISQKYKVDFAPQPKPLGTGHALNCAVKVLKQGSSHVLVVNGDDSAFYSPATLRAFLDSHKDTSAVCSIMTLTLNRDSQLGRVIRDKNGNFLKILEHTDYLESGLKSQEINCGAYIFEVKWLRENIDRIPLSQTGEYYITELLHIAKNQKQKVNIFELKQESEWIGINTQEELELARKRIIEYNLPSPKD